MLKNHSWIFCSFLEISRCRRRLIKTPNCDWYTTQANKPFYFCKCALGRLWVHWNRKECGFQVKKSFCCKRWFWSNMVILRNHMFNALHSLYSILVFILFDWENFHPLARPCTYWEPSQCATGYHRQERQADQILKRYKWIWWRIVPVPALWHF